MAWIEKISDKEIKEKGVSALSDRPNLNNAYGAGGLTAKQLKEWFDQLANLIILKQNDIIDKTDPAEYAPNLPMDISGEITTLADFIAALKDGTLADEGLMVEKGEEKVSLASFLGELVTKLSVIGSELSNGLAGKVDREPVTSGTWLYKETKDGSGVIKTSATNYVGQVATYGNEGSGTSDAGGHITTSMPKNPYHAAPREYVDTNAPAHIVASMNTIEGEGEEKKEYVLRLSLVNRKGDVIPDSETSIDLPLEMAFVGAALVKDEDGNEFVEFALQNGEKLRVGLSEIFNGKVDKIIKTSGIYVYTTEVSGQGSRQAVNDPKAYQLALYDAKGVLHTNDSADGLYPEKACVNRKELNKDLAGRVPTTEYTYKLYGTRGINEQTGKVNQSYFSMSGYGMTTGDVVNWLLATNASFDGKEPTCTIGACDPIKPIQAANKRYVDGKVEPITNDIAVIWDALGGAIEYSSVDSTTNPVIVPSNMFPAATIDKIGTGIVKGYESRSYVEPSETSSMILYDASTNTISMMATGLVRILVVPLVVTDVENFSWTITVAGGSWGGIGTEIDSISAAILKADGAIAAEEIFIDSYQEGQSWTGYGAGFVANGDVITSVIINGNAVPVRFDPFAVRITVTGCSVEQTYGVPVASVKKGTETIYTVPEEIRALTYDPTADLGAMPVYGLAMSETVYNYLDLEKKQYVIKCAQNVYGEIAGTTVTIDVSEYLTDEDGEITVAAGDEILFVDADGNSVGSTVPSTITYIVKKGSSSDTTKLATPTLAYEDGSITITDPSGLAESYTLNTTTSTGDSVESADG